MSNKSEMTQDTKAAQITAALEAIKLFEDMYSMELAEPEAMASLKAALKSPPQPAPCPQGMTCSGDGWDCVGDDLCKPAPEVVELEEAIESAIRYPACNDLGFPNPTYRDLVLKAARLHLQRQRGGV